MNRYRRRLIDFPVPRGDDAWSERRRQIRELLLEDENWANFKKWGVIQACLYTGIIPSIEKERQLCDGTEWEKILESHDSQNGTLIHQVYSLVLFEKVTGQRITDAWNIFEFGGGYGEMARLVHEYFVPESYTIFDFPELSSLQWWYLDNTVIHDVEFVNQSDWLTGLPCDLLIAICSLSEAPIHVRQMIFAAIAPENLLIRYQYSWDNIDNLAYFRDYAYRNYWNVDLSTAPEYANHGYIIAWNRKK